MNPRSTRTQATRAQPVPIEYETVVLKDEAVEWIEPMRTYRRLHFSTMANLHQRLFNAYSRTNDMYQLTGQAAVARFRPQLDQLRQIIDAIETYCEQNNPDHSQIVVCNEMIEEMRMRIWKLNHEFFVQQRATDLRREIAMKSAELETLEIETEMFSAAFSAEWEARMWERHFGVEVLANVEAKLPTAGWTGHLDGAIDLERFDRMRTA